MSEGHGQHCWCSLFTPVPFCTDRVTVQYNTVLLVQLVEGKNPLSVFNILFDYFYLKIKTSFTQTGAVIKFDRVCDCK